MTTVRFFMIGMLFSLLAAPLAQAASGDERILLSAGGIVVTGQDLQQELLLLTGPERIQALATPDRLKNLLRQIYLGKRLTAEAERLGLDRTPLTQARLMAVRRQTLSEALREQAEERIEPPDITALAREHYATRRDEFQLPDQFRAAHILKKVRCDCERDPQRQRIEQLRARLQAGEDFAALAKTESEDTESAVQGGDLGGWVKREQLVAPFADAMVKLEPGQVSGVVETQYGFHLIKLLERQPARLQSFEEAQSGLEERLRKTYNQEQLRKQAASYMPGADAKFDDPALEAVLQGR
ncbi:MAG: hypothetical protein F9K25_20185 [Candidatus Contendobacter sp.]|nr:MAG: hypothetical protein F9K25_20185 [Candidatus Contendobacter sp.]